MNPNYVNDRSKFYSKQKTSLHHGPPIVTIKRKTEGPQNENLKKFTPVIAYKEIVSCLFIM